MLNHYVIRRMVHENTIRILFRFVFPFFLNDHFPSDYCNALRHGSTRWVVMGTRGLQGGEGDQVEYPAKTDIVSLQADEPEYAGPSCS